MKNMKRKTRTTLGNDVDFRIVGNAGQGKACPRI